MCHKASKSHFIKHTSAPLHFLDSINSLILFLSLACFEEVHSLIGIADIAHYIFLTAAEVAESVLGGCEVVACALCVLNAAVNGLCALENLVEELLADGSGSDAYTALSKPFSLSSLSSSIK